jgi:formimidoylglutamate deiminase
MTVIHARQALTPEGWRSDVRVSMAEGRVAAVQPDAVAQPGDDRVAILLPAMANVHSHAFQRAMAGLAERRDSADDSFWTWREAMYGFALAMSPEDVEAVAAQLYVEMLEAGFGRVGEFHYLHHDRGGRPYDNVSELGERIVAAADEAGIRLTLLPVFYAHAGFGGQEPLSEQRRFICDPDLFGRIMEGCRSAVALLPGAVVGMAPHSLRAVTPAELAVVLPFAGAGPIHIHAAEQTREVEDCVAALGQRPVDWLLSHAPVGPGWCLIHATHMTPAEAAGLAGSGAVAGLCPVTEANLGDGIFDGPGFIHAGGRFAIGSDSNVLVGLPDELRQLEYAQRLVRRARNVLASRDGSTGRALFDGALAGGAAALGPQPPAIREGADADVVSLDASYPSLAGRQGDEILDAWIFACSRPVVDGVWIGGVKRVSGGRHHARDRVAARFSASMRDLRGRAGPAR